MENMRIWKLTNCQTLKNEIYKKKKKTLRENSNYVQTSKNEIIFYPRRIIIAMF